MLCLALLLGAFFAAPAFAVTESEVEAQVAASSKEAVTGNVLIWFLCAVGFLKVSQKIDSFMQSIGLNVGHTGGSLIAEALIATRGVKTLTGFGSHASGSTGPRTAGSSGTSGIGDYFKGGLIGMASRRAANNAVKTATNNTTIPTQHSSATQATSHSSHSSAKETAQGAAQNTAPGAQGPIPAQASTLAEAPRLTDQSKPSPVLQSSAAPEAGVSQQPTHLTAPNEPLLVGGAVPVPVEGEEQQQPIILTDSAPSITPTIGSSVDASPDAPASGGETVIDNSEQSATLSEHQTALQGGSTGIIQTATHSKSQVSEKSGVQTNNRTAERSSTSNNTMRSTHTSSKLMPSIGNSFKSYGIGGAMFMKSLSQGGGFANDVIGRVARGDIQTTGTITGEMATQALNSYMGVTAMGADAGPTPSYSHVEIGGGRISGLERAAGTHQDVQFCMYDASQYAAPQGEHTKVVTADGVTWYKQYEQDAADRKPYMAPDGAVAYNETIVKRMPNPPQRKSRL